MLRLGVHIFKCENPIGQLTHTRRSDGVPDPDQDQFRFLRAVCLPILMGSVDLILAEATVMRFSVPLDLSSLSFVPLSRFIRSRRPTPLVSPSLVLFPPCSA